MNYKPENVLPYRIAVYVDPTNPGSILAGEGSLTVTALVEWDPQEGKERPQNGELNVEKSQVPLRDKDVRQARAEVLHKLSRFFKKMALNQEYLGTQVD